MLSILCLLVICMSLEKCLFPTFCLGCLFFWYWVVWAACIILDINSFSVVSLAIIFAHSEGCLFTLFIVSFAVQKCFIRSHNHMGFLSINIKMCLFCFYFHYFILFPYIYFYFHYCRKWVREDLVVIFVIECFAYVFL